jgi:hypothetical protein
MHAHIAFNPEGISLFFINNASQTNTQSRRDDTIITAVRRKSGNDEHRAAGTIILEINYSRETDKLSMTITLLAMLSSNINAKTTAFNPEGMTRL